MAEPTSKADLLRMGYKGYQGWGESEAMADWRATGGSGKYDVGAPATQQVSQQTYQQAPQQYQAAQQYQAPQVDFDALLKQAQELYQQTIQPQVQAMGTMPAQAESRYQQLLKDVTAQTQKGVTEEMTRRGIPISSGMTQDIVGQRVATPIAQAGQIREETLANIAQQLAALQSGAMTGATGLATSLYGTQMGAGESAATRALDYQRLAQEQQQFQTTQQAAQQATQLAQQQYEQQWPYKQREYEYALGKPYYEPKTATGAGGVEPTPFPSFGAPSATAPITAENWPGALEYSKWLWGQKG